MNPRSSQLPALPDSWSPEQALAAFELIDLIRDQLWVAYGPAIQLALRKNLQHARRPSMPRDGEDPF
jgi:hypothetical protein